MESLHVNCEIILGSNSQRSSYWEWKFRNCFFLSNFVKSGSIFIKPTPTPIIATHTVIRIHFTSNSCPFFKISSWIAQKQSATFQFWWHTDKYSRYPICKCQKFGVAETFSARKHQSFWESIDCKLHVDIFKYTLSNREDCMLQQPAGHASSCL